MADRRPLTTAHLKARARELGFALCGLAAPDPPPHLDTYEHWLAHNHHGEMSYLASDRARQRRADPRLIFPECKTIIVVALPHTPSDGKGPIAAYALGHDYHDIIPRKLAQLIEWLEAETGRRIAHKIYTDTGPLLERELAQRAGLGWIGKNTMLIHPKAGSCFLLGEAFIDLELPPDPPFTADHCGSCARCIEACPTRAILPNRALDARLCISYLTIELKGSIPEEHRERLGGWAFGCDVCQSVCPWNVRFAANIIPDPNLSSRIAPTLDSLAAELSLTPEQFNAQYKTSPIKRAKRSGYLRNVAVALANVGGEEAARALEKSLAAETDPLVRKHVEWAIRKLQISNSKHQI
ncbi:MAG: tRNA epoxyqueuosine(34) reductase QueG [Chloroflexi bacterium]|nr:tRNA epoxyqueuosine(34) reductase QueG [Chloroflexota bacterium]